MDTNISKSLSLKLCPIVGSHMCGLRGANQLENELLYALEGLLVFDIIDSLGIVADEIETDLQELW